MKEYFELKKKNELKMNISSKKKKKICSNLNFKKKSVEIYKIRSEIFY